MQLPQFGATVNVDKSRISYIFGPQATREIKGHVLGLQKALRNLPEDKVCVDISPHKTKSHETPKTLNAKIRVMGEDGQNHSVQTRLYDNENLYGFFRRIKSVTQQFVEIHGLQFVEIHGLQKDPTPKF